MKTKTEIDIPISIHITNELFTIDNQNYSRVTFSLLKFLLAVTGFRKYKDSKTILIVWNCCHPLSQDVETLKYYESQGYVIHLFECIPIKLED